MKTVTRQSELQVLEQQLQQQLQTQLPQLPPIKIKCALKQGVLLVLVEHRPRYTLNTQQVFVTLEQSLQQIQPQSRLETTDRAELFPVRLYLRLAGQQHPYAVHPFILEPEIVEPTEAIAPNSLTNPPTPPATSSERSNGEIFLVSERAIVPVDSGASDELFDFERDHHSVSLPVFSRFPLPIAILAVAVSLTSFGGTVYALTRPCVITACVPLETAQRLHQESTELIQTTSAQQIVAAYENLVEAVYLLGTIPPWSKQHATAQALLPGYAAKSEMLGTVVSALELANQAAHRSQNPPHPIADWEEIQALWRRAIAHLERVPQNSPMFALAQSKLTDYRNNLNQINQRILIEQKAQEKISLAKSTAETASARSSAASVLEDWQLALSTWQVSLNLLSEVPRGTMAYAEAQQLLALYEPKLAAIADRRTREEIAATAYNEALRLAEQARNYESQNRWTEAVTQWRNALANAQQVPTATTYHSLAQPLVSSYTTALTDAQTKLRQAQAQETAQANLERTCSGTPRVCTFRMGEDKIQVRVTADYDQAVRMAIAKTEMSGDYNTRAEVANHVNTFLRALAAISENTDIPIELYNSDGSVFGTYVPSLSGYVPQ
jgi:tetratricopeptide (TPR) repeat protein